MTTANILISGATSFIGKHLVTELRARNILVTGLVRDVAVAKKLPWLTNVKLISWSLDKYSLTPTDLHGFDTLIHLAWEDLASYESLTHIEPAIGQHIRFLQDAIDAGIQNIAVTGTCFEYGKKEGVLSEFDITNPTTPYGIAKDTVRKFLQCAQSGNRFKMKWIRLFYVYGDRHKKIRCFTGSTTPSKMAINLFRWRVEAKFATIVILPMLRKKSRISFFTSRLME